MTSVSDQHSAAQGEIPSSKQPDFLEGYLAKVRRQPDAVALISDEGMLTYQELDQRANRVAAYLHWRGIGAEQHVGVCLPRGLALVTAILGVLKAGSAYVVLDPEMPVARLNYIVDDAELVLLLTQRDLPLRWASLEQRKLLAAFDWLFADDGEMAAPSWEIDPRQTAYSIYTSGSTGRPKGVMVERQQLGRYITAITSRLGLTEGTRTALLQSLTVDFGLTMLYPTLCSGGVLHLVSQQCASDPLLFARYVQERTIEFFKITPSHWAALTGTQVEPALLPKRGLIFGGESLRWSLVQALHEIRPALPIYNHYGPTEATIGCLAWQISLERRTQDSALVPLGMPLGDAALYVLDEDMKPAEAGSAGEIYIGGPTVARGYLRRVRLTAERFMPDPFSGDAGQRLYRTGDQGRVRADGLIEYLGRLDDQVKIHGYRVEPGEVAALLVEHEAVREAVVLVREDAHGDLQLVAYVVPEEPGPLSAGTLRSWMRGQVLDYLIPTFFVFLDQMPLLPHGKVDRRALAALAFAQSGERASTFTAPRTALESLLSLRWQQVLGGEQPGVHDHFLECGGHSLLAMRLLARVRQEIDVELPPQALFIYPTIAQLAAFIEKEQREQVQPGVPRLVPQVRPEHIPLSLAQQSLWFFYQLEPTSPFYNIPLAFRLRHHPSHHLLEKSLNAIVQRHEVLRTVFASSELGEQEQRVQQTMHIPLPTVDLRTEAEEDREASLDRLMQEEARRPFVLEVGPLVRALLVHLALDEDVLLLTFHHIVFDGWSQELFLHELAALYTSYEQGGGDDLQAPGLPELALQYVDYTLWQRQWLQAQFLQAQLAYWRRQLQDAPTVLNLPVDHPRPPLQTFHGAVERFVLPPALSSALKGISQREGVTLFMTLLAAFGLLLSRYSGQREVLIGSPVANRRSVEAEALIGFFVNMLVLRCDLRGRISFHELLQRIRAMTVDAYAHQDVPFEYLVQEVGVERTAAMNPLFQVAFVLQREHSASEQPGSMEATWLESHSATAKFDLVLDITEKEQALHCKLEYATDLFEQATIARMVRNFQTLLDGLLAQPSSIIAELPLLHEREWRQLLAWSTVHADYPRESCIHELFEEHAQRQPDAIALVYGEVQLSYGELDRYATGLAHRLRELGVGPEVMVGTCFERSPEQIIVILAILKAGGCYVPIEPNYPEERLNVIFENANLSLLLAQPVFRERLARVQARVVYPDVLRKDDLSGVAPLANSVRPDNLAHVLYTSGSTGKPKGVSVTHRNVARLVRENNYARLDEHEVLVQYNPIAFDASTLEMWCSLLTGARLVIAPPGILSLSELAQVFQTYAVTTAWITAGLFHQLVDHHLDALLKLRQVMAGGDVLSVAHVRRFLEHADGSMLMNGYGPTENTVFTCCYPMHSPQDVGVSVPIGRVIANTEIYVLDEERQPVPIGVYGELYVGGDGLSRGYFRRPDLTAERYLPHPFSQTPGERLYRTGDIVRFVADGTLEFLGRSDFQVKVRGFRIEPGEIEAALQAHPQVRDAVVVVQASQSGDKRLVAYVLVAPGGQLEETPVRDWLRTRLPEYMLPGRLVAMEAFPLSPNGKVDRRALPAPAEDDGQERVLQYARTPIEELLVNIWCQALGLQQVEVHDNFFERGGHSLLAMSIIARIRHHLSCDISLRTFMENPTIEHLALCVEQAIQQRETGVHIQVPALTPQERPERLALSLAQQRLWFLCQLDPHNPFYNITVALRLRGALQYSVLEAALAELVRRHEVLRTHIVQEDGEPFQWIEPFSSFHLPLTKIEALPSPERERELVALAQAERARPFDLTRSSLMRAQLIRLAGEEHVLLLAFHHLIFDGWSQQHFLRELSALYQAFKQGKPSPLADLAVQYADYALWQRQWLTDEVIRPQLRYWQELLREVPTILELPADRPRPPIQTFRGATVRGEVPEELVTRLRQMGQHEGYTFFMLFAAAFGTLLSRLSGQAQILLGTPGANRHLVELETLLGFCVNTVLVHVDVRGEPAFRELLRRVREAVLQASAQQDVPFEKLVEVLAPRRSLSHNPLFQVGFGFWSRRGEFDDWGALQVEPLSLESSTVKQDLMLDVVEWPDGSLHMQWDYNRDLFERSTIERWQSALITLLQAALQEPDRSVVRLPLLSAEQIAGLCQQGCGEHVALPEQRYIHELIAWQASQQPEAEALLFDEQMWNYRSLMQRVHQLARQLHHAGIGPDTLVGIYLERSPALIVAVLGVLSAGGAYVPLDITYPRERLAFMCHDAHISLLLTQEALRDRVPVQDVAVALLDDDGRSSGLAISDRQGGVLAPCISEEQLAYVIYTSGSTGRPKGVMVTHRGICSLVEAQKRAFGAQKGKRILQFASFSFDASVWEMVMALGQGGTLVLAEQMQLIPGPALQALLREQRINTVTLSPSVLAALPEGDYPDLQQIIVAGEACGAEVVSRWGGGRQFFNAYGPTETTVCASAAPCIVDGKRPPIGSAIANLELYVLDKYGELVLPGVSGELYVGGIALARGYLGREEQTAESFVPHPWNSTGARLYRTKDQVRWRPDGQLEYLGRLDQQVKVRGFRIELGEIEEVLRQQEEVHECIVIAREDQPGEKRLVGYVVVQHGLPISMSVLRERIRRVLPEYMVPAVLVQMEQLPITANAKIDVARLPMPDRGGDAHTDRIYVAPGIPLERDIADVWCEVLHLEKVSIHDGFFDLGGHSLLLTRLQHRLSERLGREITLVDLFQHTTVSAQAAFLQQRQNAQPNFKQVVKRAAARQQNTRRRVMSQGRTSALAREEEI